MARQGKDAFSGTVPHVLRTSRKRRRRTRAKADSPRRYCSAQALALIAAMAGTATAQTPQWPLQILWAQRCATANVPACQGQWAGPYDLSGPINPTLPNGSLVHDNPQYDEIAHALVLPGTTGAPTLGGKVVIMCEPDFSPPITPTSSWYARAFLWNPNDPGALNNLTELSLPSDIMEDPFCSAHVFDKNGNVLTVGGASADGITNPLLGSKAIYRLDTSTDPPIWFVVGAEHPSPGTGTPLVRKRFYPSALTDHLGQIQVYGHGWDPHFWDASNNQNLTREVLSISASTTVTQASNKNDVVPVVCTDTSGPLYLVDYSRFQLLLTGAIMYVDDVQTSSGILQSWFLPVELGNSTWPVCADQTPRWLRGVDTAVSADTWYAGGSAVHVSKWVDSFTAQEVVYLLGGTHYTEDDPPCPSVAPHRHVEKMVDPRSSKAWNSPDNPPDLPDGRKDHNTVILLDGSLLVVGGMGGSAATSPPSCVARKTPLLYRTPEMFGMAASLPDNVWLPMAVESETRVYHSVAGLLPDGRVFSAGGTAASPGTPTSIHSVEIFSPPYMFWGPRPRFSGTLPTTGTYDASAFVTMNTTKDIARVAILRSASDTHATDFSQRFVELRFAFPSFTGSAWSAQIQWPKDSKEAPPGYYMLTAIDVAGVPSVAAWVKL